jgi:protein SCO1/2
MKFAVFAGILPFILSSCSRPSGSLQVYYAVPEFHLTAQDGQPFDSKALNGKIWVADFIYTTCPGPCPRMTSQMKEVQNATKKMPDVKLVSFTVDPERDTPEVLAEYAKLHRASPGRWYFLTGPSETLGWLDWTVFKLGKLDKSLEHSTRFVLVDRRSAIRGYYDTSEAGSIAKLIDDIHALAQERG